jgi:hypothetical protein
VVPTLFGMKASGRRWARAWVAFQPVHGDEHVGGEPLERVDGIADDGLEQRAVEVEPSHDGVDVVDAGEPLRVPADVDDAGVAASRDHDEALAATLAIRAWSSRIRGSGSQPGGSGSLARRRWCGRLRR